MLWEKSFKEDVTPEKFDVNEKGGYVKLIFFRLI
jgi:hypothetical protein